MNSSTRVVTKKKIAHPEQVVHRVTYVIFIKEYNLRRFSCGILLYSSATLSTKSFLRRQLMKKFATNQHMNNIIGNRIKAVEKLSDLLFLNIGMSPECK